MSEPHQRTKSGKLGKPSKPQSVLSTSTTHQPALVPIVGIANAIHIADDAEASNIDEIFKQTPTTLTDLHVETLQQVLNGICGQSDATIDKEWRKTWNVGAWKIGEKLYVSCATMQPNISGCWIDVHRGVRSTLEKYARRYSDLQLPNSTCKVTGTRTPKVQGRWSLTLIQALLSNGVVSQNQVSIANLNISGSKIFFWLVLSTESKYLCTLTLQATDILKRYIPDWCSSISEVNSAQNFSIRLIAPEVGNDASQLTINRYGSVQYTGRRENIQQLYSAIRASIVNTMESVHVRVFLQSLSYRKVSE